MSKERTLIVNADDFGRSEGVNRGIVRAHREGILTSASLMVRWPATPQAVEQAGGIDLGLHIDLGEWVCREGTWISLYERAPLEDADAVEKEVHSQLDEFRRLTGCSPTHLDSHQHVHMHEPVLSVARKLAADLGIPLRARDPNIHFCGSFYGQSASGVPFSAGIELDALLALLAELRPGITELGCHPGEDALLASTYRLERFQEVQVLCHPRVRERLVEEGIRVATFAELHACK